MTYYQVIETEPGREPPKRVIYTFERAEYAHDMVELILKCDPMPIDIKVEEYEADT